MLELRADDWPARSGAPSVVPTPLRSPPRRAERAPTAIPPAAQEVPPDVIARLDRIAAESPDVAYARARRFSSEYLGSRSLEERITHYKNLYVARLLERGANAFKRARLTKNKKDFAEALRLYDQALDLDPTHAAIRQARDEVLRFMKTPSLMEGVTTFVQSETLFTPPVDLNVPPGFETEPNDPEIRPAQPPAPRIQLAIEMTPSRLRVGDKYDVRYFLVNRSATSVTIGAVTVKNRVGRGSVTGGSVEPLVRKVAPRTRAMLLDSSGSWRNDPATRWTTSLTVVLDDGGSYAVSLRSIR
jgi:hypothetical protein